MRIKELEDVLVLVDELPPAEQMRCVRQCAIIVWNWEARCAEPPMSDVEWMKLRMDRLRVEVDAFEKKKPPRKKRR